MLGRGKKGIFSKVFNGAWTSTLQNFDRISFCWFFKKDLFYYFREGGWKAYKQEGQGRGEKISRRLHAEHRAQCWA